MSMWWPHAKYWNSNGPKKHPLHIYLSLFSSNCSMLFPCLANFSNSPLEIENLHHGWETHIILVSFYLSYGILFHMMMRNVELLQITLHQHYGIVPGGQWWWKKWVWNNIKAIAQGLSLKHYQAIAQGLSLNTFTYLCKFDTKLTHLTPCK
jgi:hypothetical protein